MTKREKIIVVIMIVTVIYGVYDLFVATPLKKSRSRASVPSIASGAGPAGVKMKANKMVNDVTRVLRENDKENAEIYAARRAEDEWNRDPFSESNVTTRQRAEVTVGAREEIKLVYSGYLEIGKKKVAIINGVDYRIGDELEMGGYRVNHISPSRVTVVDGSGEKVTVPFLDE